MNNEPKIFKFESVEAFYNMGGKVLAGTNQIVHVTGVVDAMQEKPSPYEGKVYRWFILKDASGFNIKVVLQGNDCNGFEQYGGELVTISGFVKKDEKDKTPDAVKISGARLVNVAKAPDMTHSDTREQFHKDKEQERRSIVRQTYLKAMAEVYPLTEAVDEDLAQWNKDIKNAYDEAKMEPWLLGKELKEEDPFES